MISGVKYITKEMNLDYETIIEIEDYIQYLDETIGLKVETIQDIAQALHKQKLKLKNLHVGHPDKESEKIVFDSCEFAEWLQENRWFSFINGKWNYTFEHGTSISSASYDKNYRKTTEELYAKFCKERGY